MTYILQILNIPNANSVQDAERLMGQAQKEPENSDDPIQNDGRVRMARFARNAIRHYPNAPDDETGKRTIWPEELNPELAPSKVWSIALGEKGQKHKVVCNLAHLASEQCLHILDPQVGLIFQTDGWYSDFRGRTARIDVFEASKNFVLPAGDVIGASEASWLLAQSATKHLQGSDLKLCKDFQQRVYWQRQKEISWGIEIHAFEGTNGFMYIDVRLRFVVQPLAKQVYQKLVTERLNDKQTMTQHIDHMRRRFGRNYYDFSVGLNALWAIDATPIEISRIAPTYQSFVERCEQFWPWFKVEVMPQLQSLRDVKKLRELIDTNSLRHYYRQPTNSPRQERFLLALMTEYDSPNIDSWRKRLPFEWWDVPQ